MKSEYKLVGLQRLHNPEDIAVTLEFLDREETFPAPIIGTMETKEALWKYCGHDWKDVKIAEVEHDGIKNGYPVNPKMISIRLAN